MHRARVEPAVPHRDERPDERPHHLVQERVRPRRDLDAVTDPSDREPLQPPNRPARLRPPAERREIVLAEQRPAAASRIGATASAPGRCQTNRASNGSGHGPVSIRYRYSRAVAENRASNPSGARRTSSATTSGASIPLIDRWRRSRSTSSPRTNDATCPRACTPASVRPATESFGASPRTRASASDRTPSTVRCPEFRAHPRNDVPSYASESRTITSRSMTTVTAVTARGEGVPSGVVARAGSTHGAIRAQRDAQPEGNPRPQRAHGPRPLLRPHQLDPRHRRPVPLRCPSLRIRV